MGPRARSYQPAGLQYQHSRLVPSQASVIMQHGFKPIAIHAEPVSRWHAATAMQSTGIATWARPSQGFHFLTAASPDLRTCSTAQGNAQPASMDTQEQALPQQQLVLHADLSAGSTAQNTDATSPLRSPSSSLYGWTPPGRPPGRRCAVVRWVLNQRALWREQRLTAQQLQYMTILGTTY